MLFCLVRLLTDSLFTFNSKNIMNKDIIYFGKSVLIFVCLLTIIDIAIGLVADKIMPKMPNYSGQLAKDNFRLHKLDTEVVIIGSSRGSHHYVTKQLSDSLDAFYGRHLTIYNAAIDGKFANSNCCAAEVIIARYSPKLVIFDLPENQLRGDDVSDIEFSAPFYWNDSIVHRYLNNISLKERILMKSSLYRYNGKLFRIANSFLRPLAEDDGYLPLYGTAIDTTKINKSNRNQPSSIELNSYKKENFENVLKKYANSDVPLVVVCSPRFRPNDDNQQLYQMCKEYGIPFIDLYDIPFFNSHPELFKDAVHLNDEGAHLFTALLFEKLKPNLENIVLNHM